MDRKDLGGDPVFPHYNYYAGSSHLQQFPYYDYSMSVDCYSSWPPPRLDHDPGYLISTESVNDATSGSDNDDDDDCVVVDKAQVSLQNYL